MWDLGSGSFSARLQAGIGSIPECPPEGGRYMNVSILSSHTNSFCSAPLENRLIFSIRPPRPRFHIRGYGSFASKDFFACKELAKWN